MADMRMVIESCRMFEGGMNPTDIAYSLGRTRRTISNWLTTQGYQVPTEAQDLDDEIKALYDRGLPALEISKRLGLSSRALSRRGRALNLNLKAHGPVMQSDRPRCSVCGIPSGESPCQECKEIEMLGRIPINAELHVLMAFISTVWGEEEAREILQDIWDNDKGVARVEDMLRGTGLLKGALIA
jgi:hypothetical protein